MHRCSSYELPVWTSRGRARAKRSSFKSTEIEEGEGVQSKRRVGILPRIPQHGPQFRHRIHEKKRVRNFKMWPLREKIIDGYYADLNLTANSGRLLSSDEPRLA